MMKTPLCCDADIDSCSMVIDINPSIEYGNAIQEYHDRFTKRWERVFAKSRDESNGMAHWPISITKDTEFNRS